MKKFIKDVRDFHIAMNCPALKSPQIPPQDRIDLRKTLIKEEVEEADVEFNGELHKLAKELVDVLYVVAGTANEYGLFEEPPAIPDLITVSVARKQLKKSYNQLIKAIDDNHLDDIRENIINVFEVIREISEVNYNIPLDEVWDEVHRSNMEKKDGPIREDGKRLKPPGWKPPNIKKILGTE